MARTDKSALVDAAVTTFQRGESTDYSKAARHFKCDRMAVSRRIRGLTKTRKEATHFYHAVLTVEQGEVLIRHISHLTDQGMPPTSSIFKNLVEEIRGHKVGKNWVRQFVKCHKLRLKSQYLRNGNNIQVGTKYAPIFELFFVII